MPTASMPCRRIWLAAIHFQCRHDRESELLTHEATARRIITLDISAANYTVVVGNMPRHTREGEALTACGFALAAIPASVSF